MTFKGINVAYLIYNAVFLLQILASVEMRRFLSTSRLNDERDDAAAARRDRALHAWRNLGSPPATAGRLSNLRPRPAPATNVISAGFLTPGVQAADLIHTAVSIAASTSPGSAAGLPAGPRIGAAPPTAASPAAARPVPIFLAPPPPPSPFTPLHHSTPDASINEWYRKAAAAREARRPVYRATSAPTEPPPKELALLAERFRTAAAANRVGTQPGDTLPSSVSCSGDDSFATANLSNSSILESDFLDNSIALTPVTVPVPVPVPPPDTYPPHHPTPLPGLGFNGVWYRGFGFGFGKLVV